MHTASLRERAGALRILVVDDHPQVRDIVAEVLSDEGHDVVETGDAEAAGATLLADRYDATICDVRLPKGSGLDVAEAALRQHVPVLLCTGDQLLADALSSAGIPHLRKPFTLTALMEWVDTISFPDQRRAFVVAAQLGFARLRIQVDRVTPSATDDEADKAFHLLAGHATSASVHPIMSLDC